MPIDRRNFLQTGLKLGAGACMAASLRMHAAAQRASVADFGADPTGRKDSTAAVRKAVASLNTVNARLVFPAGRYLFEVPESAANEAIMQFNAFDGIEIYANNAELHVSGPVLAFAFTKCRNVALHDMKLDWTIAEKTAVTGTCCVALDACEGVLLEEISVQRAWPQADIGSLVCISKGHTINCNLLITNLAIPFWK